MITVKDKVASTRLPFYALCAISVVLLQGILIGDFAFGAMLKAIYYGKFDNGKALHRVYTGLPVVDELLAMSVSFWDAVALDLPALRLESIMLCASLQTFAVWATIESLRKGRKHPILQWAPIYIFCWQYFGTGIFYPFYCFVELNQHFDPAQISDPSVPYLHARSLIPAAVLAVLHPYRMVYFPPSNLTESQHQTFIAYYQLGPFICYSIIAALTRMASGPPANTADKQTNHAANADVPWIKATYAIFGLFSAAVHLSVVRLVLQSTNPDVSLSRVFIPQLSKLWAKDAASIRYVEESLFFLSWDMILVVLAAALYMTRVLEAMAWSRTGEWSIVRSGATVLGSGLACMVLGPGAVVSAVLYVREDFLRRQWDAMARGNGGKEIK